MESLTPVIPAPFRASPEQLQALLDAILSLSANLSLADTLQHIVRAAAGLTHARYAALGVPNETGTYLAEFITTGITKEAETRIGHRPRGHGLLGAIMHGGQTIRLRDLSQDARSYGFPPHHPPMHSFLGTPVRYKGRTLGNLYLTDKRDADEFSADDERLVELLASHAGLAIENARLYGQVQRLRVMEERQRIGMDLHDGIIQSIYAVGLTLEVMDGQLADGDTEDARERLRAAIDGLNNTIRDIRSYILDLRPTRFTGDDLVAGLHQLLVEFRANTLIAVDFSADPSVNEKLTPDTRLALFHVAQEALSNAAKHSQATAVTIALTDTPHAVSLSIRDNGRGFDLAAADRRVGHGLLNMQDRIEAQGGRVEIDSRKGEGTEVRVEVGKR
jgi:signal transduction histidine kinase